MTLEVWIWLMFRALRWIAWAVFFGWTFYFLMDKAPHLNSFGHLLLHAEVLWFGSACVAWFAGFMELMWRERAGLPRPHIGQFIPPKAEQVGSAVHSSR